MRKTISAVAFAMAAGAPGGVLAQATEPGLLHSSTSAPAAADQLRELVDRAWALSRQSEAKAARSDELAAREAATRTFFAGPPSVSLDLRRDLPRPVRLPGTEVSDERGKNELEPGFAAPLWLPGQRDAQRRTIERERQALGASAQLARWQLAGEVREAVWRLAAARAELGVQQARLEAARALEADVTRRQRAGDLARADVWMAQGETRAAQAALIESTSRLEEARVALAAITGVDDAGELLETPVDTVALERHPQLQAATESFEAARSRLDYARTVRRDNPTFSIVGRFDRDASAGPYRNTVRMGISVPFATEARNAPRITAAAAEATELEIALERERRQVAAEQRRARVALEAARAALIEHTERAQLARDTFVAIERSFRAGERGLPEVIRVRAALLEADLAREAARHQVGAATARLNQASGDTP